MNELAVCRASIAQHSKSFALASKLLPAGSRDDAAAIYAWCRRADDAIDLASPDAQPAALVRLRRELATVYGGEAQSDPVLVAFQEVVHRRGIPAEYPHALLDGMEMDVAGTRYDSMQTLLLYCFRVAGTVGLMMCHVMGVTRPAALRHAAHLGMGMQITNICRDVEEDFERGRLYVPHDLLIAAGAPTLRAGGTRDELVAARRPLQRAVRSLLEQAEVYYRSGDRGLPYLSWRAALSVRTARLVYSAIGGIIGRARYDVLSGRAVVPKAVKIGLALLSLVRALVSLPGALLVRFRPARLTRALRYPHDVLPV